MNALAAQSLPDALRAGCAQLGLALTHDQRQQLLAYLELLRKWNKVYNLTALRDPARMLTQHMLDSLAVIAPLRRRAAAGGGQPLRLLDVGSGGGLPGAVIAICCPDARVDCVDTVAKKAAFIQQVAATLPLPNLRGIHARVENLPQAGDAAYDVVASRAFASLADFTAWSVAALKPGGMWLAMKGKYPAEEIAALPAAVQVFHVEPLVVPGLDAERCIVWLGRNDSCV